jgi:4-hydroxy-tetrahydrodipicolinate reductase
MSAHPLPTSTSERTTPLRLVLFGARGRMGAAIIKAVEVDHAMMLHASLGRGDAPPMEGDVVMDFSSPEGSKSALAASKRLSAPLLVGTTGLSADTMEAMRAHAAVVPVMVSSNTSLGVALLDGMVDRAARVLGSDWRVELEEWHHAAKRDAPSGTALQLARTARQGGATLPDRDIVAHREGMVVGTHEIRLIGPFETLSLRHEARDRTLFAHGAVTLATWLCNRPAGWYTLRDWLAHRVGSAGAP